MTQAYPEEEVGKAVGGAYLRLVFRQTFLVTLQNFLVLVSVLVLVAGGEAGGRAR